MTEYVVGFMFNEPRLGRKPRVLLIEKLRPKWQAGQLNGPGGKIEPDETADQAMVREFAEETGISTTAKDWTHFATVFGRQNHDRASLEDQSLPPDDWCVYFFRADGQIQLAQSTTDEDVVIIDLPLTATERVIPQLRWLIPLGLQWAYAQPVMVQEAA